MLSSAAHQSGRQWADLARSRKVRARSRHLRNGIRFPEVLLGIARAGAVPVPVNFKFQPPQHVDLVQDCESRIVFGSAGKAESVLASLADGGAEVGIVVDADSGPLLSYEDWLASSSPERCDHGSAGNDVCMQVYTSG